MATKTKLRFKVISYEVWGNAESGWEVNDAHYTGDEIELPEDATDRQIFNALKRSGLIKDTIKLADVAIEGESEYSLYINDERTPEPLTEDLDYGYGKPVYELRRIKD